MSTAFGYTQHTGLGTNGFEVSLNYITGIPDPKLLLCSNTLKLAFKSLLKRDSSTKEKSISAMLEYVRENPAELDDDLTIMTWVQMYPKLSIDDSKKVRSVAHQIQSQFVFTLGKSYVKYLRDTIGVWLSGVFDADRSTARACRESIDFAFGSKKDKISNLWKIFTFQIVQYSHQVLAYENKDTLSDERFSTKDESEAKYLRVLQASILVVVHALIENDSATLNENTTSLLSSIFSQENLLDAFSSKDFSLKKSAYMAFKSLVISKHVDSIMDKHSYKALSKAMIKGIKFDSKVNSILYSNVIITIMDTLVCVTSYNPALWINIKKADEKLLSLLEFGSLNSEPIYYDIVYKLLKTLPAEVLDLKNPSIVEPYFVAFLKSLEKERTIQFLEKGWKVLISIIQTLVAENRVTDKILDEFTLSLAKLMDSPRVMSPILVDLMHEIYTFANENKDVLLDVNSAIMDALPDKPIILTDFANYTVKNTRCFVESFINLLVSNKSDLEEILMANSIEAVEEISSPSVSPSLSFTVLNILIKKNAVQYSDPINTFVETIPKQISKTFVDPPLETLSLYSHSSFADDSFVNSLINQTFISLQKLNLVNKLLKIIPNLGHFNLHEATELNNYLVQNSKSSGDANIDGTVGNEEHGSLYQFLTLEILLNLYQHESFSSFISNCSKHYDNNLFLDFSKENPDFIEQLLSIIMKKENLDNTDYLAGSILLDKLEENLTFDESFAQLYQKSLLTAIGNSDLNFASLESRLAKLPAVFIKSILQNNYVDEFKELSSFELSNLLSMENGFDLSSYMFVKNYKKLNAIDVEHARTIINKAFFYCQLLKKHGLDDDVTENNIVNLSLVSEFSSDILFLNTSLSPNYEEKIIEYQTITKTMLLSLFDDSTYTGIVESLISDKNDEKNFTYLLSLLHDSCQVKSYYSHRILKKILVEKAEQLSNEIFEKIDFKPFIKHPTLLFTLLDSAKEHLTSKNLEYARTNTVANLISMRKPSNICFSGMKELLILNAFINVDLNNHIPDDFTMISPQRCLNLLNTISNWLDSEVTYEESFQPVRIVIMQFIQRYIDGIYYVCDSNYPSDFINKVFQLGAKLLSETVNLVNSEDELPLDLLSWSLKLYIIMNKYKGDIETWDDECSDTEAEIIELFFKVSRISYINQPIRIICSQFSQILSELVEPKTMAKHYESFYDLMKSRNIQIQRLGCILLHQLIPEAQDSLVVEFTLSKKKADEKGNSGIHLPAVLLQISSSPLTDYIEFEDAWKVYQYLWAWYLIMDHFKNITQQMRQDYINDLGEERICLFLNFIFGELDFNRFKIHEDDKTYVKNYDLKDNLSLNYEEETKKLLVNLAYEIMNNIGGTFAQNWFHSIKDKQFQQSVEKFIIRFISPELINDILSTLSDKNALEDPEFKININRKTNEIKCHYNIDEQKMEISILLPSNFPLSQITVNGISRVGVDEKKWKSWIMSAQYVINFQNGTILDSIKHFKDNVTANFENYEDCAICYSILNAVDHSTPNKVCPTCKHNFHSACLYRWFKSSGSSTCPLCRSKFQFKKHS
ncbi:hypothetical protein PMKS-003145 [Pichia membranifaciens]|uniref:E3 ubiquitin-protein ligase listerin n=1 Tax=Pichia membranifaciens TaxID=4926 RepID=A0A1Q2YJC2_9ASCO|nr:hypothetical protein PMKS-003145 [Pichia membranifaciens]